MAWRYPKETRKPMFRVALMIPHNWWDSLGEIAADEGQSRASLVRGMVGDYLRERGYPTEREVIPAVMPGDMEAAEQ